MSVLVFEMIGLQLGKSTDESESQVATRTYGITNPTFRSATVILAVAYSVFLIIIFLRADADTWAVLVIPTLPLLPLAYAIHRGSLAWIRIREEEIEIVPSWFHRKFWNEHRRSLRFDSRSELLFCRCSAYGAPNGLFIILRSHSGPDQILWSTTDTASGAGRRWWSRIAQEISNAHDLKTRLIEQTVNSQGALETEWPTVLDKTQRRRLGVGIVPALSPWLGIGARMLTADPSKLVLFGLLLWICAGAWIWYWPRLLKGKLPEDATSGMLIFTLQFATFYTFTVLVTGVLLHH